LPYHILDDLGQKNLQEESIMMAINFYSEILQEIPLLEAVLDTNELEYQEFHSTYNILS